MLTYMIFLMGTLLASGAVAAYPLLCWRQFRTALQGIGGTLCLAGGAAGFFVLASGLVGPGARAASAQADDADATPASKPADESAFFTTAEAGGLNTPIQSTVDDVRIIGNPPPWVGSKPLRDGAIHTTAVCTIPYESELKAEQALDQVLEQATADYIEWALGSKLTRQFIHYSADEIKQELVSPDNIYSDKVESPTVGVMQRRHALLQFRPEFRERIQKQWNEVKAKWRLAQLGLVAGGAILLLGTVFSYFRLDTATRGYYTGRLQFLSAAAILAIVAAGAVLAQWIAWL